MPTLTWTTGEEVMRQAPETLDDSPVGCDPCVRRRSKTITAAKGKLGKTTKKAQQIATDTEAGITWMIVSEEPKARWRVRWERWPILATVLTLFREDNHGMEWSTLCNEVADMVVDIGADAVLIDTITTFAGLSAEGDNLAGEIEEKLDALVPIVAKGPAVELNHHRNKSHAGDIFDSIRGSGQYINGVDIVQVMDGKVGSPSPRTIYVSGREYDPPLPIKMKVTRDPATGFITVEVDSQDAHTGLGVNSTSVVVGALKRIKAVPATFKDLEAALPDVGRTTLRKWVYGAVDEGAVIQGQRGKTHNFQLPPSPIGGDAATLGNTTNKAQSEVTSTLPLKESGIAEVERQRTSTHRPTSTHPAEVERLPNGRLLLRRPEIARQNRLRLVGGAA